MGKEFEGKRELTGKKLQAGGVLLDLVMRDRTITLS